MVVNSVLSTGIQGIKRGVETAENAAQDIANLGATRSSETTVDNPSLTGSAAQGTGGLDTLTQAVVDLKVGEQQVQASAAVVKTADEMMGTLINIKA
jgi:hypothetical protein